MLANLTVRWALIYFCIGCAAAPLLLQTQVRLEHFIYAGLALYLIYKAPVPTKED